MRELSDVEVVGRAMLPIANKKRNQICNPKKKLQQTRWWAVGKLWLLRRKNYQTKDNNETVFSES